MPTLLEQLRLLAVLTGMAILPGWAALSLLDVWRRWEALQRWIVAIGISLALYPVLFYGARWLLPFLPLGPYKMAALLLLCAVVIVWRMRKRWLEQFRFDRLELVTMAIFGMTLVTRFWIIRDHPYPAWSDSLHHALLTRLTAVQGQLPSTLEPYFPVSLDQYHLGLYAITATTQWLAQVPAHTALLWTVQGLNGLCGLGVYLVLDRKLGRPAGIVGAVTVGLLSHQPAFYVNWGRFTQLAGQTVILIAWMVTWETLGTWRRRWPQHRVEILFQTALAALLNGSVFLLHFRVGAFYLPLLGITVVWELWRSLPEGRGGRVAFGTATLGAVSLFAVAPAVARAIPAFPSSQIFATTPTEMAEAVQRYYEFPWDAVPYLASPVWLLALGAMGAVFGLFRRNEITLIMVSWTAVLYLFGNAYLLSVPRLSFTNLGAILILLYLPLGVVLGATVHELLNFRAPDRAPVRTGVAVLVVIGGLLSIPARARDVEPHRFFITPADVAAMEWIRENTAEDALFAVNTYFWLPKAPHGTDAGYWIPYFTGRETTAGVMLLSLAGADYTAEIVEMSQAVEALETSSGSLDALDNLGVDYIYLGKRGDFSGSGLKEARIQQLEGTSRVYQQGGVSILRLAVE